MTPNSRPAFKRRKKSEAGLTLIEILVAMTVLAFIGIAIYEATTRSFDINFRLGNESTDYTALALGLQAVESDLAQIYNPVMEPDARPVDQEQTRNFWSAPVRSDGMRRARLQGSREKISFINNGNRRVEQNSPQSDFQKVSWQIERNSNGTYSLLRTTDWDAFLYDDGAAKPPPQVAVLENMTSARFSYFRRENKQWEDQWDSENAYAKAENRFPDLISLKIEVPDPANPAVQQQWELIVKPNLPLNGTKKNERELLQ